MGNNYYDWHAYGSDASGSIEYKLRNAEHYLTNKLGQIRDRIDDLNILQSDDSSQDLSLIEKGMYAQMLTLVGREKDAKKIASEWIEVYEKMKESKTPDLNDEIEALKRELAKNRRNR